MPMFLILIGALIAPVFFMATHSSQQIADSAARVDNTRALIGQAMPAQMSDSASKAVTNATFYQVAGRSVPAGVTKQLQENNLLSATTSKNAAPAHNMPKPVVFGQSR